ncbi:MULTISPECIES: GatB/YqeY domain-containing protein [Peptoniphilus]|jgi:gatB/yqey domain protein|uniref:GatB/YqeY domain-containing protein n=2 Tax=Peptoniphilaceae TaxID=1570339 RepID=UPI000288B2C1|nr:MULTISPECIES: GatB/YqeY domain-containing protein [Peptoniphilus]MBS6611008.1 GatB/YqeY domain-containing protein [Peptoniphilus harei]MDU1043260.1 GatB/YqeY domain-containing protein [Peptoniphilus rhinitidis]MDU1953977.1 GatB/YqeY domain-containing protein [Peptoniphilus lacydonensis]MDU2109477.1 GatB/YqeY domain-containing protein [Peptoniphilus lacydonensis]MDU2115215.1 GatB/YqeY domain-containing protein [Peptoniphilus lacydonensis]
MSLKERLMADLKTAMKEKDKLRKDVITMVRASVKQKEVDERVELEDADIENIISKQLKEKKASIEEFKKGNREDLVEKTNDEIEILLEYLPEQLSDEELKEIIKKVIDENNITSMKDIGLLMKNVMPLVKGKADGKQVNVIAKELLN